MSRVPGTIEWNLDQTHSIDGATMEGWHYVDVTSDDESEYAVKIYVEETEYPPDLEPGDTRTFTLAGQRRTIKVERPQGVSGQASGEIVGRNP
jgi:hypothetical protein